MLFIPGGDTAELQPADISIQQPLKHSIKQQAMQFFAESVCRNESVLDLRLGTMKRLMAHRVLHACAEVEKTRASQRKLGATSLGLSKRHQCLRRAPLASTSMAHSSMRRRWNKRSHRRKRTSFSMTTTTMMTLMRIPRARHSCCGGSRAVLLGGFPSRTRGTLLVSALRVRQAPTETLITNCFQARCRTEGAPASCR